MLPVNTDLLKGVGTQEASEAEGGGLNDLPLLEDESGGKFLEILDLLDKVLDVDELIDPEEFMALLEEVEKDIAQQVEAAEDEAAKKVPDVDGKESKDEYNV